MIAGMIQEGIPAKEKSWRRVEFVSADARTFQSAYLLEPEQRRDRISSLQYVIV